MRKVILHSPAEIIDKINSFSNQQLLPISEWKELLEISSYTGDKVFFLALTINKECIGGAIFSQKNRRIARVNYSCLFLYGYDFFDFNPLFIDEKHAKNYISFLNEFAQSKGLNFITLENLY